MVYRFTTTSCIVGLQMGILLFVLPCVCPFFFLSRFFVNYISTTIRDSNFKFGIQIENGWKMGLLLFVFPCICSFFFLSRFVIKDISTTYKIETANLVYRFTTTSCNVGLKIDILLSVLAFIFLSLYIFRQRYQPYALEALKRGYSQIFWQF